MVRAAGVFWCRTLHQRLHAGAGSSGRLHTTSSRRAGSYTGPSWRPEESDRRGLPVAFAPTPRAGARRNARQFAIFVEAGMSPLDRSAPRPWVAARLLRARRSWADRALLRGRPGAVPGDPLQTSACGAAGVRDEGRRRYRPEAPAPLTRWPLPASAPREPVPPPGGRLEEAEMLGERNGTGRGHRRRIGQRPPSRHPSRHRAKRKGRSPRPRGLTRGLVLDPATKKVYFEENADAILPWPRWQR